VEVAEVVVMLSGAWAISENVSATAAAVAAK
jgi:hypothetical protein